MPKLTLVDFANLNNEQSVVTALNQNNAAIESAYEITLSRDGTQPNQMDATLDMDSNRIINLPTPISNFEPVRKIDLDEAVFGPGVIIPPTNGGTAGVLSIDNVSGALTTGQTLEMIGPQLRTRALTGAVVAVADSFVTSIASGAVNTTHLADDAVTNAKMSNMNGRSFKGNHLSPIGPVQDIAIINLNQNTAVDPANDWMLCHDNATNTLQRVNATQLGASGAWVTSVEGQKGAVNLVAGTGISIIAGSGGITITNTGDGPGTGAVDNVGGMDGSIGLAPGLEKVPGLNQLRIDEVWLKRPSSLTWYIGNAGNITTNGQNNIGIGDTALGGITTGVQNIAIGSQAGQGITKGGNNILIGLQALDVAKNAASALFVMDLIPLLDQTVTIGGTAAGDNTYRRIYRFRTTLVNNDDVLIGVSQTATITNLRDAINHTATGQGTRYKTVSAHPLVVGGTVALVGGTGPGAFMGISTKDPDGAGASADAYDATWNSQLLSTTCPDTIADWTRPTLFGAGHAGSCIAIGSGSLAKNVASNNYAIGVSAGSKLTTADSNILIGPAAGFALAEGIGNNTMIGYQTGYGHDTQTATYGYCTALGTFALQWCGWGAFNQTALYPLENTAVGATAGLSITIGDSNTAVGANALGGNFEPSLNANTGRLPITGSQNTGIGDSALRWVSTCGRNTAVGFRALFSRAPETSTYTPPPIPNEAVRGQIFHLTGNDNVAVGWGALHTAVRTSTRNVAIGSFAIGQGTKPYVLANEADWSYQEFLADNFEGSGNIAIGAFSGYGLRQDPPPGSANPSKNIFIGDYATSTTSLLQGITTGSNNVIIGGEITGLGNISNNIILATGNGATKILWWTGTQLKIPCFTTPGLLAIDENSVVTTGAVTIEGGGTGISTYLQGDMIYAQSPDMLVTLTKSVVATEYLSNTGTANAPKWAKINLSNGTTGQLPIAGIAATGTANATTFLRGDGTWAPGGGGGGGVIGPGLTTAGRMATYADTSGNILSASLIGSATQVLHGGTDGVVSFGAVNLATDVSGNLSTNNLAGGSGANNTTFWRGDGQWAAPPGGTGTGGVSGPGTTFIGRIATYGTADGNTIDDNIIGSATQVLHGGIDGVVSFSSVNLAADVTGQLPLGHLAGGAAGDGTKFLAGDNTWKTVTATGGSGSVNADGSTVIGAIAVWKDTAGTLIGDLGANQLGTVTTVLHGNAIGAPFYDAVHLVNDTSGVLSVNKGGTGSTLTGIPGGIAYFSSGTLISSSGALTDNALLLGGGSGNPPTALNTGSAGQILISQGATGPSWQPLGGAIQMTGSTGTIIMNSGVNYPEMRPTGSVQQKNSVESIYAFTHEPASGASGDGIIIGRLRFDAAISTGVSRVFGAIWCQMLENTGNVSRIFFDVSQGGSATKTGMVIGGLSTSVDLQVPNGDIKVTLAGKGFTTSTTGFVSAGSGGITTSGKLISTGGASTDGVGYGAGAGSSVTQTSSNISSVAVGASQCGVITTMPSAPYTLAAGAVASFPVSVTGLATTDTIIVNTQGYTGTGTPVVHAGNITANAFRIYVQNIHATVAMNDNLIINWSIIKSTSAGTLLVRIEDALDQPQVDPE